MFDRMKSFFLSCFMAAFVAMLLLPMVALAQEALPPVMELDALLQSLGGWAGAGALGIAFAAVNVLMYLLCKTSLGNLAGKYKLSIAYGLYIAVGILSMRLAGVDIKAALLHANTLAAIGTFANQIFKQFIEKKD